MKKSENTMRPTLKTGLAALITSAVLAGNAFAAGFDVNVTSTDLALRGVDPVSYFTAGAPQDGDVEINTEYNGAVYRFISEENKAAFMANPAKYAPQYGGYCAFGLSKGFKFDGDPDVWSIVEDKLYLNLSPKVAEIWKQDIPGLISDAEVKWTEIKNVSPAELQ
jgi:YHS domain-containing protein